METIYIVTKTYGYDSKKKASTDVLLAFKGKAAAMAYKAEHFNDTLNNFMKEFPDDKLNVEDTEMKSKVSAEQEGFHTSYEILERLLNC